MKIKRYHYTYEDHEDENKDSTTMIPDILNDPELEELEGIEIGSWGNAYEENCQSIINGLIAHKERFSHIKELSIGIMDYEDCEISWIMQGDYSGLYSALPNLRSLTIQGSTDLLLRDIRHDNLEELTIMCGGLPVNVIHSIQKAKLPKLKKLVLYIGIENYGFDGDITTIETFLKEADFPSLTYLGLVDSEMEDDIVKAVITSKYMGQVETLDFSMGVLKDEGGAYLLEALPAYPNIKTLDLHYHYLSDEMTSKFSDLPITVDVSKQQKVSYYRNEAYYDPMITE